MSTNMAFKPCSMFFTRPLKMLPTMLRSLGRSMVYSSSTPFSRSATRRSSFSQLMTILLPVWRGAIPSMRFTRSVMEMSVSVSLLSTGAGVGGGEKLAAERLPALWRGGLRFASEAAENSLENAALVGLQADGFGGGVEGGRLGLGR